MSVNMKVTVPIGRFPGTNPSCNATFGLSAREMAAKPKNGRSALSAHASV
jgi:hypothetical protein